MTEIKGPQPLATNGLARPGAATPDLALKLLQPLSGLLAAGDSATAEVVEVKPGAQDFQLLLRMTLDNGRQASVQASSRTALGLGAALAVTALSDERLQVNLQPPALQPQDRLDTSLLPVGSQLQARVLASQRNQQDAGYRVVVGLMDTSLAGQKLMIESGHPLAVGSLLTARVQGNRSLLLQPTGERLDRLDLVRQLTDQHGRQGSLASLLQALQADALPPGLREPAGQLLARLPELAQLGDAGRLAQALEDSGLFLEARLQAGLPASSDLKADLLRLIARMLPGLPGASPLAAAQAGALAGQALPAFARQMLGSLGRAPAQQALGFPLPPRWNPDAEQPADLEELLKLAAAAIARLQTHQLASLAQTQTTAEGLQLTTWQMELPLRDGTAIVPLQARLQREEQPAREDQRESTPLWRIDLAFDLAPLGPLQVQAQLFAGSLSGQLWAERADTTELVRQQLEDLRQRLLEAGLTVGELNCRQGIPLQSARTALQQRLVDDKA